MKERQNVKCVGEAGLLSHNSCFRLPLRAFTTVHWESDQHGLGLNKPNVNNWGGCSLLMLTPAQFTMAPLSSKYFTDEDLNLILFISMNSCQAPQISSVSFLGLLNFLTRPSDYLKVFSEESNGSVGLHIQLSANNATWYDHMTWVTSISAWCKKGRTSS